MLTIGNKLPDFELTATVSNDVNTAFQTINQDTAKGMWKILFFWPKDFTFVCPTEIAAFGELQQDFMDRDAVIWGASVDSEFVHLAWRQNKEELNQLPFPMLADVKRELASQLGVLDPASGVAMRATFIIDPENIIRSVQVTDMNVGRNTKEILRVLDALQTDELCPCNWQKDEPTIQIK